MSWPAVGARLRTESEPFGDAGTEPLDEPVGAFDEIEQHGDALR